MVLMAIGSFALLELAAVNLRGDERRGRSARAASRHDPPLVPAAAGRAAARPGAASYPSRRDRADVPL